MKKRAFAIALLALGLTADMASAANLSAPAMVPPQSRAPDQAMTPVYGHRGLWALPLVFGGAVLYSRLRYEHEHAACYHECRYDHSPVFCRHACW
jgi:hypothetical protein